MNRGQVEHAERRALSLFDDWNDVTGVFLPGISYYNEVTGCIEDAVHVGIQMALYGKVNIKDGNVVRGDSSYEPEAHEVHDEIPHLKAVQSYLKKLESVLGDSIAKKNDVAATATIAAASNIVCDALEEIAALGVSDA